MTDQHRDDRALAVLDRLLDDVPVRPAPMRVVAPPVHRGRRRALAVVAAAAAVALVAGLGVVLRQVGGPSTETADPAGPPPGWREVGIGQVTLQVPAGWTVGGSLCSPSTTGVVAFMSNSRCARDRVRVRSSWVLITRAPMAVREGDLVDAGRVDGHAVLTGTPPCRLPSDVPCPVVYGIPDLGAWFTVAASDGDGGRELLDQIRGSFDVLPEGRTTVPAPLVRREARGGFVGRLEDLGLRVEVVEQTCPPTANCFGFGVDPQPGSVVDLGDTVTVTGY